MSIFYGFIYLWENTHPAATRYRKYIGQHIGSPDDGYIGSGTIFKKVFYAEKYQGYWVRTILQYCIDIDELNAAEAEWIKICNAQNSDEYCNLDSGGMNKQRHPDSNKKQSLTRIQRGPFPAWNKGLPHNPTTKAKISAALKGKNAWNNGVKMGPQSADIIQRRIDAVAVNHNINKENRRQFVLDRVKQYGSVKIKELCKLWDCSITPATQCINSLLADGLIKLVYFGSNDVRYVDPAFSFEQPIKDIVQKTDSCTIMHIIQGLNKMFGVKANFVKVYCTSMVKQGILINVRGYRKNFYSVA